MANIGSYPGVKVSTSGAAVPSATGGRAQYTILVGYGDNASGSASVNDPVQISRRPEAENQFGSDTDLSRAYELATANGANSNLTYGIMAETTDQSESFTSSDQDTLANTPILEDPAHVTFKDANSNEFEVRYVYEDTISSAPNDSETVFINPYTGDWYASTSDDFDVDYETADWSSAISAATDVPSEDEFSLIAPISNAESVATDLASTVNSMVDNWKMTLGLMGAEPNARTNDYTAGYDTGSFSHSVDDDRMFLVAPPETDEGKSIVGAYAGLFSGNALNDPVFNDGVSIDSGLSYDLSASGADDLRNEYVIPVRDRGTIQVRDNLSTSTATDWTRDYWRRRIVDNVIAIAHRVGDQTLGLVNDEDVSEDIKDVVESNLEDLVDDGVLRGGDDLFVDATIVSSDEVAIDLGVKPYGVIKQVDASITVSS